MKIFISILFFSLILSSSDNMQKSDDVRLVPIGHKYKISILESDGSIETYTTAPVYISYAPPIIRFGHDLIYVLYRIFFPTNHLICNSTYMRTVDLTDAYMSFIFPDRKNINPLNLYQKNFGEKDKAGYISFIDEVGNEVQLFPDSYKIERINNILSLSDKSYYHNWDRVKVKVKEKLLNQNPYDINKKLVVSDTLEINGVLYSPIKNIKEKKE